MFILVISMIYGIDEKTKKRFEAARVYRATEIEVVKLEIMKPDIERYQGKTDTDRSIGLSQIIKNNIRKTNRVLLNKWLKEFK